MIEFMDVKLKRWARWAARDGQVRGLWYARASAFVPSAGGGGGVDPELDQESSDLDACVVRLPDELRLVVVEYYRRPGTQEQKARACGVSKATFFRKLDHAQQRLAELIGEVEAVRRRFENNQAELVEKMRRLKSDNARVSRAESARAVLLLTA